MSTGNVKHLPLMNPTLVGLEVKLRDVINETIAECESSTHKKISLSELMGLLQILAMDYYMAEISEEEA